jgi:uncharacterized protein YndB with AHSA1/START domain
MKLTARAALQIQKPVEEVFEAIVAPEHITRFFIAKTTGRMETGSELSWEFGDFPGKFPVHVIEVVNQKSISFVWDPETKVHIKLEPQQDNSTVLHITEGDKPLSPENLDWLADNSFGWGNFLDCLKAYLEYGIQLRTGAFDYRKEGE